MEVISELQITFKKSYPFHFTVLCLSRSLKPGRSSLDRFIWTVLQHFATPSWLNTTSSHSDDVHLASAGRLMGNLGQSCATGASMHYPICYPYTENLEEKKKHLIIILTHLYLGNNHQFPFSFLIAYLQQMWLSGYVSDSGSCSTPAICRMPLIDRYISSSGS